MLELLEDTIAEHGYRCHRVRNGADALRAFRAERPPLLVTDIVMPVMSGLDLLKRVLGEDPETAVLVLSGSADVRAAVESLNHGAYDFLVKPVAIPDVLSAAARALEHRELLIERREYQSLLERRVAEATRELSDTVGRLQDTYRATLEALGSAIDSRDVGTHDHSRRVRGYSMAIARAHGVSEPELTDIEHGVLLHDIGKIGIPDSILLKPGPLTPAEWQVMRRHPEIGRRLIERIPFLVGAIPVVYHHHERWDGTGYPLGLAGEAIPLGARIFAVADAFDAMTEDRPYSRAISLEEARERIRLAAGSHFDPAVVRTFLQIPQQALGAIRDGTMADCARRRADAPRIPPGAMDAPPARLARADRLPLLDSA
jgi:response regulator RpfG family c-di-GMP phosphodiesterase